MQLHKPLVLMILDGWGWRDTPDHNAIASAHTPQWDTWWQHCPHILLNASGQNVGLPAGQMGNSEVGHMHIGAGRVIGQDLTRINAAIESGHYFENPAFLNVIESMKQTNKALHVLGLLSPGGVHSHEQHLFAFLKLCAQHDFKQVFIHAFLDGRDTPPKSAENSLERLQACLKQYPVATLCSITGRYYAMDRDKRWERIQPAYELLTENKSTLAFETVQQALSFFYEQGIYDEFIPPTRIGAGKAIESEDAVFFSNFRADRARQLTHALIDDSFEGFTRHCPVKPASFLTMTQYEATLPVTVAFPPVRMQNTLGEVLEKHQLRQLRIAETEKYAHVTFFFNGGSEQVYAHEKRLLIPSPSVATYDLKPEMSAFELTTTLVSAIHQEAYDVIICNYANADMVGHTGNFKATVKAIEALDTCMHEVGKALKATGGQLLITADHGNAELMFDEATQQVQTAHTNQPVPLLYVGPGNWIFTQKEGSLIDIAPTLLTLLNISPPLEMTGTLLMTQAATSTNKTDDYYLYTE